MEVQPRMTKKSGSGGVPHRMMVVRSVHKARHHLKGSSIANDVEESKTGSLAVFGVEGVCKDVVVEDVV